MEVVKLKTDRILYDVKRELEWQDGVYIVEGKYNYYGIYRTYHKWIIVNGNITDDYDFNQLTQDEALKIWKERDKKIQQFKQEFFNEYKDLEIIYLRTTTLEDRVNEIVIDGWYYRIPIREIFKNLPKLKEIIDKSEDSWESGVDIWTSYERNENNVITIKSYDNVNIYETEEFLLDELPLYY